MKQTTKRKQPWSSCVRYPVAEAGLSSGEALLFLRLQLAGSAPTGIVSSTIQGVQSDNLLSRKKMWTRRKVQEVKIFFSSQNGPSFRDAPRRSARVWAQSRRRSPSHSRLCVLGLNRYNK